LAYTIRVTPSFLADGKKLLVDDTHDLITDRLVFLTKKHISVIIEHDDTLVAKNFIERSPLIEPWRFFTQSLRFGLIEKSVYRAYFTSLCYETSYGMSAVIVVPEIHQALLVPYELKLCFRDFRCALFYNTVLYHLYLQDNTTTAQELIAICLPFSINTQSIFSEVFDVVSLHTAPVVDSLHPPLNKRLF